MAVAAVTVLRNAQARVLLGRHEEAHLTDLESVDGGDGAILGEVFGAEAVAVGAVVLPEARFLVPGSLVVVASAVARHTAIEAHALVHEQERRDHVAVDDSLLMLVAGEAVLVLDVRVPGGEERMLISRIITPQVIRMGEREGGQRGAVVQVAIDRHRGVLGSVTLRTGGVAEDLRRESIHVKGGGLVVASGA